MKEHMEYINMKYVSLFILTCQSALQSVLVRYSRNASIKYMSSTVVVLSELFKLLTCIIIIFYQKGIKNGFNEIKNEVFDKPKSTLLLLIPAALYTLQTNLIYIALSHVDVITYQVTSRLKVLTTAVFFVFMLNKTITLMQWGSLLLLIFGIILVQPLSVTTASSPTEQKYFFGLFCLVVSSISSGFSSIYFEKLLKGSVTSIWIRNIQLSIFGFLLAYGGLLTSSYDELNTNGFFYGYTVIVWMCVIIQAFGGLITAMVIKYADNMLKSFASSMAIILAAIISYFVFPNSDITFTTLCGIGVVIISIFLYSDNYKDQSKSGDKEPLLPK